MMANAQSEYVWWFGDDIMRKGSIKYILEVLKNNPDFVFVNSKADKKSLNFGKNFKLSGSEAIDKLGDLLLFLSSLLWKKSFIYPYLYKYKEKFGTAVGSLSPSRSIGSKWILLLRLINLYLSVKLIEILINYFMTHSKFLVNIILNC